jgi:uncharacterized protein (DUF2147 family)
MRPLFLRRDPVTNISQPLPTASGFRQAINRKVQIVVFLAIVMLSALSLKAQSPNETPVGRWQTVSDVTGKNNGVVEIVQNGDELLGHLIAGTKPAEFETRLCDKCPGNRHGLPMKGLLILSGLHRNGDEWTGGEILDPENGKIYRAKLKLADGGKKLLVHGYLGLSLLGRTQTWTRIE